MLTTKQRAFLRGMANPLEPVFQVGKSAVSPELTAAVTEALEAREIVKLNVLENCPLSAREAAEMLAGRTRSDVVQVIGRRFTLYKMSKTKPVIELPKK